MAEVKVEEKPRWAAFKSALTRTSVMAMLYAIFVFMPAHIYLTLMVGPFVSLPVAWFTILLFVELGKLSGNRLTKQEATAISVMTAGVVALYPLGQVYGAWYRTAPIAKYFDIPNYIPDWVAPAEATGVMELRTFLHPAWITPIAVGLVTLFLSFIINAGTGLFAREIFQEVERLPFPVQQMGGTALTVITGKEERPIRVLAIFALIGFAYGFVVYAAPFIHQALTGEYVQIVPVPWIDLNRNVEGMFPGANLGIFTDIGPYATGLIISFPAALGVFIGSFAVWFFGSWLSVANSLSFDADPALPGYQSWWVPGMNIDTAWWRSTLFFWATILIGFGLSLAIAPILRHPGVLRKAFSSMRRPGAKRYTEPLSLKKVILPLLVVGLVGGAVLFTVLPGVTDYVMSNPWIILVIIGMPLATTLINARTMGETGVGGPGSMAGYSGFTGPEGIQNMIYFATGANVPVWFAPNTMVCNGGSWLAWFKVSEVTETRTDSILKIFFLTFPIAVLVGYLYVQLFWSISPIPSGRYPGITISWDLRAAFTSVWIKGAGGGIFPPMWILFSFLAGSGMYIVLDLVHSPLSFISLGAGMFTITPIAIAMFTGGLIALVIKKWKGREFWDKYKNLIAAGLGIGEGFAVTISVAMALIINSIWFMPY